MHASPLLIGALSGLIVVVVFYVAGAVRKPPTPATMRQGRLLSFHTAMPPVQVIRAIGWFAQQNHYRIEQVDETHGWILLSQPLSLFSYGFFYPIQVTPSQYPGDAQVDIGIRSRAYQYGPVVTSRHKTLATGIRQLIAASAPVSAANF